MQRKRFVLVMASALGALSCGGTSPARAGIAPEDARVAAAVSALRGIFAEAALADAAGPDTAGAIEAAIRAAPDRFFELVAAAAAESAAEGGLLAIVDKASALPPDYEPGDLVSLNDYPLAATRKDLRIRKAVAEAALRMDAAARADGVRLQFASAYRSYEYQDGLFKRYAASYGEEEASRFSARPGKSQHQLGTAFDFAPIDDGFAETKAGAWTKDNAARFGFSMSYPEGMEPITGYVWESWHFRYVTRAGAALEREYFGGVQRYMLEFLAAYGKAAP
ncbi:MAG: M15 family metallopeptidase [Spirochaetes bacterium]|nr:M15 family metallopeptidase [Spirochaetota bacterium]MBU1081773.1 M15 family metallopeptidase [Spirochaetota bacterium]